jgi:dihydrofolate reductase
MTISIIVAASENNVIGKDNTLPWHLPNDLKYFKDKTMGHCVVMGRKNFESIPDKFRPLSGRTNIVITRQKDYRPQGSIIIHSIDDAIQFAKEQGETDCFVVGGGEIFKQSIHLCDVIYITRIHQQIEGDIFFPKLNPAEWKEVSREDFKADEKNEYDYSFIKLLRIK